MSLYISHQQTAQPTASNGGDNGNTNSICFLGLIPAFIAKSKGKSFGLWWFYGAMIFIVAIVHALVMKPDQKELEEKQLSEGMKKCLHCAELIKQDAKVCRYCSRDVGTEGLLSS